MIGPATQLAFSIVENPGVYALLLGSGVSRAADIPTGWEIILDLSRRLAAAEGVEAQLDWAEWYRSRFNSEPDYSSLLDMLALTSADRRSILHNYIEPSAEDVEEGRRVPTLAHQAIANLIRDGFIKVVVTTNFDRLLESALRKVGVEPTVIRSVDDLAGANPPVHSRCYILKLHGDYLDNRILNTDAELASYPQAYDQLLDRILDEYGLIVSGWSGEWDPALRAAIERAPNRRYSTYWVSRGEPTARAQDLISLRAARVVEVAGADEFFVPLQETIETLHRTRRIRPEAIELLLASAKRFLSRPEFRIELHDLVTEEAARVSRQIASDEFPVQLPAVNWDIVNQRWDALEALAEPLARTLGLLGRWGDGSDVELAADVLQGLTDQPVQSGSTTLLGLQRYPAYLCFLTYALGLSKAGRFEDLFRWFRLKVNGRTGQPREAANSLFMSFWDDAESDWWKQRGPEYARHKTPWATYLADHVVPWSADYGLTKRSSLENYNVVELLGGFAALHDTPSDTLAGLTDFTWMPFGRLMWAEADRAKTLAVLESPDLHERVLAAGFSGGSKAHWDGVKRNIVFLARRTRW